AGRLRRAKPSSPAQHRYLKFATINSLSRSGHTRKRHVVVDCLGLLLAVMVTAANTTDREAAMPLLEQLRARFHRIALVWADGGYAGRLVAWAAEKLHLTIRQTLGRRHGVRGAAEALDGGAHAWLAAAFAPPRA
ncbi:transposase, partial [Streptomyces sp. NPDC002676]